MNLIVRSAHDTGKFCVDFGLAKVGAVPEKGKKGSWDALNNDDLITFGEVKKLVIYPMLLAQFIYWYRSRNKTSLHLRKNTSRISKRGSYFSSISFPWKFLRKFIKNC